MEDLVYRKRTFNAENRLWGKVFFDESTGDINTDKVWQRFATLIILEQLGIEIKRSVKDEETLEALDSFLKFL